MIRLSMLQFRAQAATAAIALAVFAVILAASGPHLFGRYDRSGIAACQAHGNCLPLATSFVNKLGSFYLVFYFIGVQIPACGQKIHALCRHPMSVALRG